MRLTLVNPCQPYLVQHRSQAPLGLLYLSAVLKRERPDVDVHVWDCSALSVDKALASAESADVFGFTSTSADYPTVCRLREGLQRQLPSARFIIGGPHATAIPEEVQSDGFDSVFVHEAEQTILEFVDDCKDGNQQHLYVGRNDLDLSWLPLPDRQALSWLGGQVLMRPHGPSVNIMASRGCTHGCPFCASRRMWQGKVRWRTVEDVVAEVADCVNRYGVSVYRFSDDSIMCNKTWLNRFCREIEPFGISWRIQTRADSLDDSSLEMLASAGCEELDLGIESFDPNVLRVLKKGVSPAQNIDAIERVARAGIGGRIQMMISTPGESTRTTDLNIEALKTLEGCFAHVSITTFRPLPGTAIWEHPAEYGISIDSRNLEGLNFFVYRRDGRPATSPITINGISKCQQAENAAKLLAYVEALPQTKRWMENVGFEQ